MSVSVPTAGELRERIQFLLRVDVPTDDGDAAQTDTELWQCWGKMEPIGSAYWGDTQTDERATHRFWVRWVDGHTDPASLSHGVVMQVRGRSYRITRVTDLNGIRKFVLIEAMELGADNPENMTPTYYV